MFKKQRLEIITLCDGESSGIFPNSFRERLFFPDPCVFIFDFHFRLIFKYSDKINEKINMHSYNNINSYLLYVKYLKNFFFIRDNLSFEYEGRRRIE